MSDLGFSERLKSKDYLKILEKKRDNGFIMKTPCGHKFHIPCLINWMNIKLECPSCRKDLPHFM